MLAKDFIKDYLRFSRRDRVGVLLLVFLILVIYFLPLLFARTSPFPLSSQPALAAAVDSLLAGPEPYTPSSISHAPERPPGFTPGRLFRFNPNTLSSDGWKALGLGDRPIHTIQNYLAKGGKFYKPADLQKIWGLPPAFYDFVKDSILIERPQEFSPSYSRTSFEKYEKKERKIEAVGINTGDTSAFIALPGIGSRLATRIIAFRDRLGGFATIGQVGETYGLPDSTFQKIKPYLSLDGHVKKLNINTATKEELKDHPYIRWKIANALIEYRNQHGPFHSLDDLKNINLLDDATLQKLLPYLTL